MDEVGVERVVGGHEQGQGVAPRPSGPARLLVQRRHGARPAGEEHGVEPADVDAEFERARRGDAPQRSRAQSALEGAALLGQVSAAVRGHEGFVEPLVPQPLTGHVGHHLDADPRAREGERLYPGTDERAEEVTGLCHGAAAAEIVRDVG